MPRLGSRAFVTASRELSMARRIPAQHAGFAGNGTAIAIPSSYAASQCKFTASAANIEGRAISTSVSINTSTGEVVCEKVVQEREEVAPETRDCVASYTMICIR